MPRVIITLSPKETVAATALLADHGVRVTSNRPALARLGLVSGEVSDDRLAELRRKLALNELPGVLEIAEDQVQKARDPGDT